MPEILCPECRNAHKPITPHVMQALQLMADGLSMGQISSELGISRKTIKNHLTRAGSRLNIGTGAKMPVILKLIAEGKLQNPYAPGGALQDLPDACRH